MTIKDKPISMSIREWISKKMSLDLVISQKTIDAVISHQFDGALKASHDNNSVEISGFGTFHFNVNKAKKLKETYENKKVKLETALQSEMKDFKRDTLNKQLETMLSEIKYLNWKIDGKIE